MAEINDLKQRQQALDPNTSFIVQAPAGSGKTELLTQRFLVLLEHVKQNPEEVIAITFTKKAATEMRQRIHLALQQAQSTAQPTQEPQRQTWKLAQAVLQRDKKQQWQLINNPNRLRIQTIDALCANLTRQMPVLSQFGAPPKVTNDPIEYYNMAATEILHHLEKDTDWSPAIATLLAHLDNNYWQLHQLFVNILQSREQWLVHLTPMQQHLPQKTTIHKLLKTGLQNLIKDQLYQLNLVLNANLKSKLLPLIKFAQQQLRQTQINHPLAQCDTINSLPIPCLSSLPVWLAITQILLKSTDEWRKTVNKNQGFPSHAQTKNNQEKQLYKDMKQQMLELLQELSSMETVQQELIELRHCPPIDYTPKQLQILLALIELLPILAAQLTVVFRDHGHVDFVQITQAALTALGQHDNPTNLALNLDYQIQHILFDEFQDTSLTQMRLLELITAGWQPDDGRSLFLVGDPMQSIYRFRQAEVGLFTQTQQHGIGNIKLKSLKLSSNFRSDQIIVNWINATFNKIFPKKNKIDTGEICYTASTATKTNQINSQVKIHAYLEDDSDIDLQTQKILEIINQYQQPSISIAILVRARQHLFNIIPKLQQANIAYQAIEIEPLTQVAIIQDLLALTRALDHLADRIAWLAILRAPWCGLSLNDLHALTTKSTHTTIWENIINYASNQQLSKSAQQRLQRLLPILQKAIHNRSRNDLAKQVEDTWMDLAGPAFINNHNELETVYTYLDILRKYTHANTAFDLQTFQQRLATLYNCNNSSTTDNSVQVMTIHKAKGLEFDIVIIPELQRAANTETATLLAWTERQRIDGTNNLLLAPIHANNINKDPIYNYLRRQSQYKSYFEMQRLFYVATTRAKQQLHLLATSKLDKDNQRQKPHKTSFLAQIWHLLEPISNQTHIETNKQQIKYSIKHEPKYLTRYNLNWDYNKQTNKLTAHDQANTTMPIKLTSLTAVAIGTIVHRLLQQIAQQSLANWNHTNLLAKKTSIYTSLKKLGVVATELESSYVQINQAIDNTLQDPKGQWILNHHQDSHSEYAIIFKQQQLIIDRTFIDQNNIRWIIDYKTSYNTNMHLQTFLKNQQKLYQAQLNQYATALSTIEQRTIKLGLYFPMLPSWISWNYSPTKE